MAEVTFKGVTKQYPNGFVAVKDLDLHVEDGELLVVVGPSGCGKTTTLRMLAGLEDITEGECWIGDRVVNELTPKERDIAMVFQSYALYPHLSVGDNLGYPLMLAKMPKPDRKERVLSVARQLQLEELLDRKPRQLSGGQRQRVAMGRAMVREPLVFLMDEPLSNLDAKLRVVMRSEVAELQHNLDTTMFYVTHDQIEAMTMGHRVAIMDRGILQQVAPPGELYANPGNLFVAGFIGSPPMNLISGKLVKNDETYTFSSGQISRELDPSLGNSDRLEAQFALAAGRDIVLGVRPEHVRIGGDGGAGDHIGGVVRLTEMLGSETLVHVEVDGLEYYDGVQEDIEDSGVRPSRVLVKLHDQAIPDVGESVSLEFPIANIYMFDAVTGESLTSMASS